MFRLSTRPSPRTASFTLVELLVVISIISILSSISYAGFSEARAIARDAERLTTYHDLRLALEQYYDEYGFYPPNTAGLYNDYGHDYIVANPTQFPFENAGVSVYRENVGDSFYLNPAPGVRFMQPLIDAGLWNKTIPDNSTWETGDWPGRQPNGDIIQTPGADPLTHNPAYDNCGGYISYLNNAGWASSPSWRALGPQMYMLVIQFERKNSFDAFTGNDKDGMQYDGAPAGSDDDDNEYDRTAVQYCPRGKAIKVFIHHCPGTWEFWKNADNLRGYPGTIPLYRCRLNGVIVG